MLKETNIIGQLVGTGSYACQDIGNPGINLSGIGLAGNSIALLEAHLGSNRRINLVNSLLVAIKELKEACLCAGSPLGAQQLQAVHNILQVLQVHNELLSPQGSTLAHSSRLCRLKMGECQGRQILIFLCKLGKLGNHIDQFLLNQLQGLTHDDNIGVITNIAGSSTKMNDTGCFRAELAIGINMAHNVMANQLLPGLCHIIIDFIHMSLHLINLLLADYRLAIFRKPQLHFCLSQSNPQFSPGGKLLVLRKNILHFLAGITL